MIGPGGRPYVRLECHNENQVINGESIDYSSNTSLHQFIDDGMNDQLQHRYSSDNVLSLTQRLAFPELYQSDDERLHDRKNRAHEPVYIETESNLNFFAKIITFLVLVFVVVLVVGMLLNSSRARSRPWSSSYIFRWSSCKLLFLLPNSLPPPLPLLKKTKANQRWPEIGKNYEIGGRDDIRIHLSQNFRCVHFYF